MNRKIYNRTYWVDHETPVNSENLNKIEEALYELSEKSLRPSDLHITEDSALTLETNCGHVYLGTNNTVHRTSDTLKKIDVITEEYNYDSTIQGNLGFLIKKTDSGENVYKLIYDGEEYSPKLNISFINYDENQTLEDFLRDEQDQVRDEIKQNNNSLLIDFNRILSDANLVLTKKIEELTRKLNTLSTKCDMLEDKIKDLEDKNNGLETM